MTRGRGKPWTDADSKELLRHVREGKLTQGGIAKVMGRAQGTISHKLVDLGMGPDGRINESRAKHVETLRVTAEQRRAELASKLAAVVETEIGRLALLNGHYADLVRGEGGAEYLKDLPVVPSRSLQAHAAGIVKLIDSIGKLEGMNKDAGTADIDKYMSYMLGPEPVAVEEIVIDDQPELIEGEGNASGSDAGIHEQSE